MDMICLPISRAYRPGIGFADAAAFLFDKRSDLANQNLLAILGTPDKMIAQLARDVFGVLCIHTRQYNKCSNSCEEPGGTALPLLEREGIIFVSERQCKPCLGSSRARRTRPREYEQQRLDGQVARYTEKYSREGNWTWTKTKLNAWLRPSERLPSIGDKFK